MCWGNAVLMDVIISGSVVVSTCQASVKGITFVYENLWLELRNLEVWSEKLCYGILNCKSDRSFEYITLAKCKKKKKKAYRRSVKPTFFRLIIWKVMGCELTFESVISKLMNCDVTIFGVLFVIKKSDLWIEILNIYC